MSPEVTHHPLLRADGSATYTSPLYTILAAVNGPVEVQRRDELPEEAAIEVNIRPVTGSGSLRERWLESVVSKTLRSILLVHMHPRTLVQVTLQVTKEPAGKIRGGVRDVAVLPALVNAAFLGLVDAGLPLQTTMSAALVGIRNGETVEEKEVLDLKTCQNVHAFAFTMHTEMVLAESSGAFTVQEWDDATDCAERICLEAMVPGGGEDDEMTDGVAEKKAWLRHELEDRAHKAVAWRSAS